jgi:hypothetical protein
MKLERKNIDAGLATKKTESCRNAAVVLAIYVAVEGMERLASRSARLASWQSH